MKGLVTPSKRRLAQVGLLSAALVAGASSKVFAVNCSTICGGGTGTCTVSSVVFVTDGLFDCSGRNLRLENGGWIRTEDADLVVRAHDLWVEGTSNCCGVEMFEDTEDSIGSLRIELSGKLTLYGKIRADGDFGGGRIEILAAGNVDVLQNGGDGIQADGSGNAGGTGGANGGEIRIESGGSITVKDPIHADGSGSGMNFGGNIELVAAGNITSSDDGAISASGRDLGAGSISLTSTGGNIIIGKPIEADGRAPKADGGQIEIEAAGQIQLNDYIWARGSIAAGSGDAAGGQVKMHAGCGGVALGANGDIDVKGGPSTNGRRAGSVDIEAMGAVTLANGTVIDAHGNSVGADGGQVRIKSTRTVTIDGSTVDVHGNSDSGGQGRGGTLEVTACTAEIKGTSVLDARGYHGGSITVFGEVKPPSSGTQPVTVRSTTQIKAVGTDASRNGNITLRADTLKEGTCSNDGNLRCWVHADCTVGCQTGNCGSMNPNTDGVSTQFDLAAARAEEFGINSGCSTACQ